MSLWERQGSDVVSDLLSSEVSRGAVGATVAAYYSDLDQARPWACVMCLGLLAFGSTCLAIPAVEVAIHVVLATPLLLLVWQ